MNLEKISLHKLSKDNLHSYCRWRNSYEIRKWCRQPDLISWEAHEKWYHWQEGDSNTIMYEIRSDFYTIGVCGLTSIDWINRRAEFSLYIGESEDRGRGFGKKALDLLLDKAFRVYNLNRIWGEVLEGNPALEMFIGQGFEKEGVRREFYYKNGKYINATLISIGRDKYLSNISDQ